MSTNELGITEKTARFYIKDAYHVEALSKTDQNTFTTEKEEVFCVEVLDGPRIVVSKKSKEPLVEEEQISYQMVSSPTGEIYIAKNIPKDGVDRLFCYPVDNNFKLLNPTNELGANQGVVLAENQLPIEIASAYLDFLGINLEDGNSDWEVAFNGNGYIINEANGTQISIRLKLDIEGFPYISATTKNSDTSTNEYSVSLDNKGTNSQLQVTSENHRTHTLGSSIKSLLDINRIPKVFEEESHPDKNGPSIKQGIAPANNKFSKEQARSYLGILEIVPELPSNYWQTTSTGNGYIINEDNETHISIEYTSDMEGFPCILVKKGNPNVRIYDQYDIYLNANGENSELQVTARRHSTYALDYKTSTLIGANIYPSADKRPYKLVRQ